MVTINGEFQLEEWEKDGIKHSMPCVLIRDLVLPPKKDIEPQKPKPKTNHQLTQEELDALNDEIPF